MEVGLLLAGVDQQPAGVDQQPAEVDQQPVEVDPQPVEVVQPLAARVLQAVGLNQVPAILSSGVKIAKLKDPKMRSCAADVTAYRTKDRTKGEFLDAKHVHESASFLLTKRIP